jgi:hypothetical protein
VNKLEMIKRERSSECHEIPPKIEPCNHEKVKIVDGIE